MSTYDEQRKAQIAKNKALFDDLRIQNAGTALSGPKKGPSHSTTRPSKRRKLDTAPAAPQRTSARLAGVEIKPSYLDEKITGEYDERIFVRGVPKKRTPGKATRLPTPPEDRPRRSAADLERLREQWKDWESYAEPPTRDDEGTFHFESHPEFVPNRSPEEMMRMGCFGGAYWRPLYSKTLGITVADDWKELPKEWIEGLDVKRMLTSQTYDPKVNKYGVSAGQSIEDWEASGWINHEYDVRGWFQWYCRFFLGRRCEDDERQIGRWYRCVGETGRWRRILLKKYQAAGIRNVVKADDEEGISPINHQTCLHWAWDVSQEVLDQWWAS